MAPKRILIVGSQGFIGSWILRHLWENGWNVYGVISPRSLSHWRLPFELKKRIFLIPAEKLMEKSQWSHIIYAASYGQSHFQQDDDGFWDNLKSLMKISRLALKQKARMIFLGSSSEYAPQLDGAFESQVIDPHWPTPYVWLKRSQYFWLRHLKTLGLKICYLRLFHVFGPLEDPHRWTTSVLRAIEGLEPLVVTHPNITRDFVYVKDLAKLIEILITEPNEEAFDSNPINVCYGLPISFQQWIDYLQSRYPKLQWELGHPQRPWDQRPTPWWGQTYRRKVLFPQWNPRSWQQGFEDTWKFYQKHPYYKKYWKYHPLAKSRPVIRIIIPCYRDGDFLKKNLPRWIKTGFKRRWWLEFWVICDNDPKSLEELKPLAQEYANIRLFLTPSTWGSQRILAFGLTFETQGVNAFVTLDGDGQDPWWCAAWMIHEFVCRKKNYQLVAYVSREETPTLQKARNLFYSLWQIWSQASIIPHHANFCLISEKKISSLRPILIKEFQSPEPFFWRSWRYQHMPEAEVVYKIPRPASWRRSHHDFKNLVCWALWLWVSLNFKCQWAWLKWIFKKLALKLGKPEGIAPPSSWEFWEYYPLDDELKLRSLPSQ